MFEDRGSHSAEQEDDRLSIEDAERLLRDMSGWDAAEICGWLNSEAEARDGGILVRCGGTDIPRRAFVNDLVRFQLAVDGAGLEHVELQVAAGVGGGLARPAKPDEWRLSRKRFLARTAVSASADVTLGQVTVTGAIAVTEAVTSSGKEPRGRQICRVIEDIRARWPKGPFDKLAPKVVLKAYEGKYKAEAEELGLNVPDEETVRRALVYLKKIRPD